MKQSVTKDGLTSSTWVRQAVLAVMLALAINLLLLFLMKILQASSTVQDKVYDVRDINMVTVKPPPQTLPPPPRPDEPPPPKKHPPIKLPEILPQKPPPRPVHAMNMPKIPFRISLPRVPALELAVLAEPVSEPIEPVTEPVPEGLIEVVEEPVEVAAVTVPPEEKPEVYDQDAVAVPPEAVLRPAPEYPSSARRRGQSGWVEVELVVDETGRVISVEILDSSSERFHESATAAVRRWRFNPARQGGEPVKVRCRQRLVYQIE